jgi:hypothetical protein
MHCILWYVLYYTCLRVLIVWYWYTDILILIYWYWYCSECKEIQAASYIKVNAAFMCLNQRTNAIPCFKKSPLVPTLGQINPIHSPTFHVFNIILYYIISYHTMSHISYHNISYHIISYHVISYIMSYIISCHIISYHISHHISYHIISYNII